MATSFGYKDSVTTMLQLPIPTLSYAKDFSIRTERAEEIILTNTTSPLDQPETIRFAIQNVGNVYAGTPVAVESQSVTKRGVQLLIQLNDILRVTPDEEATTCGCFAPYDLPISAHIVLRVPLNSNVSADVALQVLKRNVAALFDGDVTSARLNSMLRGALKPSTM